MLSSSDFLVASARSPLKNHGVKGGQSPPSTVLTSFPLPMQTRFVILALLGLSFSNAYPADISGGGAKAGSLKPEARPSIPVIRPADESIETGRKSLRLQPGFISETWAAEPMLANVVAFSFDDQGRCYTAETFRYRTSVLDIRSYMFMLEDDLAARKVSDRIEYSKKNFPKDWQELEKETEVVRLVEDADGSGKATRSRVYADGMNSMLDGIASGILARNGKVWLTNIPNLWQFSGITQDGKAADRKSLSFGWGVRYSYTGHDFHGLSMGPDGRLYFTIGDRGAHITDPKTGKVLVDMPDEGGVFRSDQDGSNLEVIYRGLRNPQETAFDDHGNLFTGDNDADMGDRERFVYIVQGGDSGWRVGWQHHPVGKEFNPWMSEDLWKPRKADNPQPRYVLSPILNIPDGPSGVAYYPGTGLPEEYKGHFFVCSFKGSTAKSAINHWSVKKAGAGFATLTEPSELIGATQATDVEFGPDSQIYFSDWGANGWESQGRGRIYRTRHETAYAAAKPQVDKVQALLKAGFSSLSADELSALLAFPDQRIRLRAQWNLATRPEASPTFLKVLSSSKDPLARLHAIWGIWQVALASRTDAGVDTKPLAQLLPFLGDSDPEIRANILKVIGDCKAAPLAAKGAFVPFLKDSDARVRFFAALAIGQTKDASSMPAVLDMIRENADADQHLRHAGVMALSLCADDAALKKATEDASPSVRLAALLAYARLNRAEVQNFLKDSSPELVSEAAHVITDEPVTAALPALAALLPKQGLGVQIEQRALNAAFRTGTDADAQAVAAYAADPNRNTGLRAEAVTELGLWAEPPQRDRVVGIFRPLPARSGAGAINALSANIATLLTGDTKVAIAACEAAQKLKASGCAAAISATARDEKANAKIRIAALEALATLEPADLNETVHAASEAKDSGVRTMAISILAKRDPQGAVRQLISAWAVSDAKTKKGLADTLAAISGAEADAFFAKAIAGLTSEPKEVHLEILEGAAKRTSDEVKAALAKYEAALPSGDLLAKFAPALQGGNRESGERIFKEHAVAACMRCHKVKGIGGEAGPELTGFAKTHDRQYILESIVNVNAKIAPGYQMVALQLKDGGFKAGLVKEETAETVTIQIPPAPPETVAVSNIAKRDNAPSGMIPNIADFITRRELRDVIEYVANLK